jgi:hypothetical protein
MNPLKHEKRPKWPVSSAPRSVSMTRPANWQQQAWPGDFFGLEPGQRVLERLLRQ